jgi:ATP-dependent DNA ligase
MDGWRAALFTQLGIVQSRRDNNLATRFPEIVAAGRHLGDVVLDGEVVALREGRLDFGALTSNPGSRTEAGVTIYYIAFDLLAERDRDWLPEPQDQRRSRLEELFTDVEPPLQLMPRTTEQDQALPWLDRSNAQVGVEGLVVKARHQPYRAGRTGDWRKIRSVGSRATCRAVLAGEQLASVRDGCSTHGRAAGCLSVTRLLALLVRARSCRSPRTSAPPLFASAQSPRSRARGGQRQATGGTNARSAA